MSNRSKKIHKRSAELWPAGADGDFDIEVAGARRNGSFCSPDPAWLLTNDQAAQVGLFHTYGLLAHNIDGDPLTFGNISDYDVYCDDASSCIGVIQNKLRGEKPLNVQQTGLVAHIIAANVDEMNTVAPTLMPESNRYILWPPNHKLAVFEILANAGDNSGSIVMLSASINSNEPQEELGQGDTSPDWTELSIDQETGLIAFKLRSERSGSGDGRIYTVTIIGTDSSDNSSDEQVEIIVPHDQGNKQGQR